MKKILLCLLFVLSLTINCSSVFADSYDEIESNNSENEANEIPYSYLEEGDNFVASVNDGDVDYYKINVDNVIYAQLSFLIKENNTYVNMDNSKDIKVEIKNSNNYQQINDWYTGESYITLNKGVNYIRVSSNSSYKYVFAIFPYSKTKLTIKNISNSTMDIKESKTLNPSVSIKGNYTYKSSNTKIATVNSKGVIKAKNYGSVNITVNFIANGKNKYLYDIKAKTIKITISPKKVKITSIKKHNKKKLKITWQKNKQVTGYQLVQATNQKFTKGKKVYNITKNTTSKIINKTKKNKKYWYKVRAYKQVGKKKYYSSWSPLYYCIVK